MREEIDLAQQIATLESEVLDAADAIAGFAAMDFDLVREDLAAAMKAVFLKGEESTLRSVATELGTIYHQLNALANVD